MADLELVPVEDDTPPLGARSATVWQDRALCSGDDVDNYFPEGDSFADILPAPEVLAEREAAAKKVCAACPVTSECLVYAMVNGEEHGVWGGLNEAERKELLDLAQEQAG